MVGVCGTATVLKKMMSILLLVYLVSNYFADYRSVAQNLPLVPQQEVQALEAISTKLQIENWNVSQNFCSDGFVNDEWGYTNITCNNNATHVTNPNATHVTNIQLIGQALTGNLPAEFADLTFLQEIALVQNYIGGSIPNEIGDITTLEELSLRGNSIGGSIPKEIGDIATLEELDLTDNYINGTIPTTFAEIPLTVLYLWGNSIGGSIPKEIGDIATLEELYLKNNELGGPLPQNLGNLSRNGMGDDGLGLFEQMRELGLQPTGQTFLCVLSASASADAVEEGFLHFGSMKIEYGISS
ncbi:hypothetical protein Vadar_008772 [Vaccinium darrowii]|uniref:Uncharacterized protein n=1 Tax=Vaccinium darrowii TaxID=229202 RepID=A0ACB7XPJ4_9ERIC|nr:hypothetical protein Vadar_008772 [Vaccinium darrowii]